MGFSEPIDLKGKNRRATQITVPQFDSVYGITELIPDPGNWVNACAASYYGVQSISAKENYLGISTYPIGKITWPGDTQTHTSGAPDSSVYIRLPVTSKPIKKNE